MNQKNDKNFILDQQNSVKIDTKSDDLASLQSSDLTLVISQIQQALGGLQPYISGHGGHVEFHEEKGASLEGHLLFHLGINYKIGDLWH